MLINYSRALVCWVFFLLAPSSLLAQSVPGPGLGNFTYSSDQLFKGVCLIREGERNGPPLGGQLGFGTNLIHMVNGYAVAVFAPDETQGPGGFIVWDVSNPSAPVKVKQVYDPDGLTAQFRESHGMGFATVNGQTVMAIHTRLGVQTWDFTNPLDPQKLGAIDFAPGGIYDNNPFDLFYQHPYIYGGTTNLGLAIVDASDPTNLRMAERGEGKPNPIPTSELGGFRVGPVRINGNLMVLTSVESSAGYSVMDLSDPVNPTMISRLQSNPNGAYYYTGFDGRYITASVRNQKNSTTHDIFDPNAITLVGTHWIHSALYNTSQDEKIFHGTQGEVVVIDNSDPSHQVRLGVGTLTNLGPIPNPDLGQVVACGNLVWAGNDHGTGSGFIVHQLEPDTRPPAIRATSPQDNSQTVADTARVGIAFTDNIQPESVNENAIKVEPLDSEGNPGLALEGTFSVSFNFVNFHPSGVMQNGLTYRVTVKANGVRDWAGNSFEEEETFTFTVNEEESPLVFLPSADHHWPFTNSADDIVGGNDGVLEGVGVIASNKLQLGPGAGSLRLTEPVENIFEENRTISLLIQTSQVGGELIGDSPHLLAWTHSDSLIRSLGWINSDGKLVLTGRSSWYGEQNLVSTQPINDGQPHTVVCQIARWGPQAATCALNIDGEELGVVLFTFPLTELNKISHLGKVSVEGDDLGVPFSGCIDDFIVFNRTLEASELSSLFSGESVTILSERESLPGAAASFEVESSNVAEQTFSWDFGDGTAPTDYSSNSVISHVFADPGHYQILLKIRSGLRVDTQTFLHRVISTPTAGSPMRSRSMVSDTLGDLYCVNEDAHTVTCIDGAELEKNWEVGVGSAPASLCIVANEEVWVANRESDSITVLNRDDGVYLGTIPLKRGSEPVGIICNDETGSVYVTLNSSQEVIRFDSTTQQISSTSGHVPEAFGLSLTHDGQRLFVTSFVSRGGTAQFTELDPVSLVTVASFPLPADSTTVDGSFKGRGLPNYLRSMSISPDGKIAFLPSKSDNIFRGINRDGQELDFEKTVRPIVSAFELDGGSSASKVMDLNNGCMPVDVEFIADGNYICVALEGSDRVEFVDTYRGLKVGSVEGVGKAPRSLLLEPSSKRLYVHNFLSRSVSVLDVSNLEAGISFGAPKVAEISLVANELLSPEVLLGKQLFYNASDPRLSRDGYISCAVCHDDGGEDGQVWDFTDQGEGLRNTISLRGKAGEGHGPLHWSGNFDEVQDFEGVIRNHFGGGGLMKRDDYLGSTVSQPLGDPKEGLSDDLDALAAYVRSLSVDSFSPERAATGELSSEAVLGRAHYLALNCRDCHGGEEFTVSNQGMFFDVGTLKQSSGGRLGTPLVGIDVPTLKGLWKTALYLHDGSAGSLEELFLPNAEMMAHGGSGLLSATERGELIAYLRQIDASEPSQFPQVWDVQLSSSVPSGTVLRLGEAVSLSAVGPVGSDHLEYFINGVSVGSSSNGVLENWSPSSSQDFEIVAKSFFLDGRGAVVSMPLELTTLAENSYRYINFVQESEVSRLWWGGHAEIDVLTDLGESINKSNWEPFGVPQGGGVFTALFDGSLDSAWHPGRDGSRLPRQGGIDLGGIYRVGGIRYYGRQDISLGRLSNFRIQASRDGVVWDEVAVGSMLNTAAAQPVLFKTVTENRNEYDSWLDEFALTDSDLMEDSDDDGLKNLLEYAVGLNPTTKDSTPSLSIEETIHLDNQLPRLKLTYKKRRNSSNLGLVYRVQENQTFRELQWKDVSPLSYTVAVIDEDFEEVSLIAVPPTYPVSDHYFLRLKVELIDSEYILN